MLLHHADRFAHHDIRVGDTLKFPLSLPSPLGGRIDPPYRHGTFEVTAFHVFATSKDDYPGMRPMAHCLQVRRLCDGFTTTLAAHHWLRVRAAYEGE